MIVHIYTGPTDSYTLTEALVKQSQEVYNIGCDKGAYYALSSGISLQLVIGDFDSTSDEETLYIKKHAEKVKTFKARKDFTDTYLAVLEALKLDPEEIVIYGGSGNRFDHTYANLLLLKLGPIVMVSDDSKMYMLNPGSYTIDNSHDFISFFALEDVSGLCLNGFSYDLETYDLKIDDPLCVSNQGSGDVIFEKGLLLVVEASE